MKHVACMIHKDIWQNVQEYACLTKFHQQNIIEEQRKHFNHEKA